MKAKVSVVLEHAVSNGTALGVRRFYKHRDARPSEPELAAMADAVAEAVMEEIAMWFDTSEATDA